MENLCIFDKSRPRNVYRTVLEAMEKITQSIDINSKNEDVENARKDALAKITDLQEIINRSIIELENNSEWECFTIAFYGETNAGKSTLIETLRILLDEPLKQEERKRFSEVFDERRELRTEISSQESIIDNLICNYSEKEAGLQSQLKSLAEKTAEFEEQFDRTKAKIKALIFIIKTKRKSSLLKLLKFIFRRLPEQRELKEAKARLLRMEKERSDFSIKRKAYLASLSNLEQAYTLEAELPNNEIAILLKKLEDCDERLRNFADGQIIGDGQSDFTRDVKSYYFQIGSRKFSLLDMPGIEGNECAVEDAITSATQKAHIVFYVTAQPKPPQSGDKKSEGTIDKIRKHLGSQTEVYAIYNKRVKNPNQLQAPLIDSSEADGLSDLNRTLSSNLGLQYVDCVSLSVYPAFLAVANCFGSSHQKKKEKFEEAFETADNLLQMSGMQNFIERLTDEILSNSDIKLKRANLNKVLLHIRHIINCIQNIQNKYHELGEQLTKEEYETNLLLESALNQYSSTLKNNIHNLIGKYQRDMRSEMYEEIEKDLSNSDYKSKFEEKHIEKMNVLQNAIEENFKHEGEELKEKFDKFLERYNEHISELLELHINTNAFDDSLHFNFDIKKKNNWKAIITSVVLELPSLALLSLETGGWAAIVTITLAIVGAVLSVGKAVVGALNHDYKKSQQRSKCSQALDEAGKKVRTQLEEQLANCDNESRSKIEPIKKRLALPTQHVNEINNVLQYSMSKLAYIGSVLEREMQ